MTARLQISDLLKANSDKSMLEKWLGTSLNSNNQEGQRRLEDINFPSLDNKPLPPTESPDTTKTG